MHTKLSSAFCSSHLNHAMKAGATVYSELLYKQITITNYYFLWALMCLKELLPTSDNPALSYSNDTLGSS